LGVSSNATNYKVAYSFKAGADGSVPYAGLIDVAGALYGTTVSGGAAGDGTVFKFVPGGRESVVYSFKGGTDGANPLASLLDVNGTLYGTTSSGGTNGDGTVFKVDASSGVESVVYSFKGGTDGANPESGLVSVNGELYGTTTAGGTSNNGTIFKVDPSGKEIVVYRFGGGSDGLAPAATLIDVKGELYGTTSGSYSSGTADTVFKVSLAGKETPLYHFSFGLDGENASLLDVGGELYGTTDGGGSSDDGSVFKLSTAGVETTIYSFTQPPDGAEPLAGLIEVNDAFYGTTVQGGNAKGCANEFFAGCGTIFTVSPSGVETVLHEFEPTNDGEGPTAPLLNVGGTLYGTTTAGGASGNGTIFSLTL
jgi:uncharacterized repeat protein (TIGR03803 family)